MQREGSTHRHTGIWRFWITAALAGAILLQACNLPSSSGLSDDQANTATAEALGSIAQQEQSATPDGSNPTQPSAATSGPSTDVTAQPTAAAPIEHQDIPTGPSGTDSFVLDRSSQPYASESRTIGDNFDRLRLERPFNAESMDYQPWLDLTRADLSGDPPWLYLTLQLEGTPPDDDSSYYGLEIDLDMDGRGDWLAWGPVPSDTEWSVQGVQIWHDANHDVGGAQPLQAEAPGTGGDGYEQSAFDSGQGDDPDAAWVRRDPNDDQRVQLAIKHSMIGSDGEFLWNAWADGGLQDPSRFDYNDHMTIEQAGSPVQAVSYYPLKDLAQVDNTCRWAFGFEPTQPLPGLCPLPTTPTPVPPTPTWTPTSPPPKPTYTVSGVVFRDDNGNGRRDSEPGVTGAHLELHPISCGAPASNTVSSGPTGGFSFSGLSAGTYCVKMSSWPAGYSPTTSTTTTVVVGPNKTVSFGIQVIG